MRRSWFPAFAGLAVLGGVALVRNTPDLAPGAFNWAEPGNVAAALVEGRGFSDPFGGGTGATAWVPPLPVWIESAVFLAAGVKTVAAARILLVLAVLGLAGAHALLYSAARPFGAWMAGGVSAAFLAFVALLPGGPLEIMSEAWIDVLLSAALLWAALEADLRPGRRAVASLSSVAALAPLADAGLALGTGLVVMALAWRARGNRGRLAAPIAAAIAAALAVGLWTGRNALALHRLIPLKTNLWFEVYLANVASTDGLVRAETALRLLPFFSVSEFDRYSRLGETRYVDSFRRPSIDALAAAPIHLAANIARRLENALIFCHRDDGSEPTRMHFDPGDLRRLEAAGELIPLGGTDTACWTRIDAPPRTERAVLDRLGLAHESVAWRDWAEKRVAYDEKYAGPAALAEGFLVAGIPTVALAGAALLLRGRLPDPAGWAVLIGASALLPFILVNHGYRHQWPLVGMQAVAVGAFVHACAHRRRSR